MDGPYDGCARVGGVPRAARPPRPGCARRAFSLIELLTVIGILAILLALLMPAMVRARATAQSLVCQSNLRQIHHAALQCSLDRRGYVQLAGSVNGLLVVTPQTLEDQSEQRYLYFDDGAIRRPAPLQAALAPYLGQRGVRLDSAASIVSDVSKGPLRKVFTCPSQPEPIPAGIMIATAGVVPWFFPSLPGSYAYNEGLLGFEAGSTRRQRGLLARARPASEVVFMTDAVPRAERGLGFIAWYPSAAGRCTLADCYTNANGTFDAGVASQFDPIRHAARINIVFADGHAENLPIHPRELERCLLLAE